MNDREYSKLKDGGIHSDYLPDVQTNDKYQWHGKPVRVEFGYSRVEEDKEKPLYWYNYHCHINDEYHGVINRSSMRLKSAHIPAIRITDHTGYSFAIGNMLGIGVHKVLNGGWPNIGHYSLPDSGFVSESTLTNDAIKVYVFKKFELEEYEAYSIRREAWFKSEYPEEYKKKMALMKLIKGIK